MEEFDRYSNASSEEQEDELMLDAEEGEDHDQPDDHEHDDEENENENENENEEDDDEDHENEDDDHTQTQDQQANGDLKAPDTQPIVTRTSATPAPSNTPRWQFSVRPEYLTAPTYDIVPTMAAPMSTSINAVSITPDLRYWMTGGADGYIRKYHGPDTINGKTLLTVAQRHPFVDSVVKAGVLMSYWENAEAPSSQKTDDLALSPVYSLAVHSQALWLLSGLESGGINLQSVRHDEGKRITCLQKHTNAVSVLSLSADEKSVLSGSWDKNIFDWDLNMGAVKREFDGIGSQVSAIEVRPMSGMPFPPEAAEEDLLSDTFFSNNAAPATSGDFDFSLDGVNGTVNGGLNGDVNHSFVDGSNGNLDGGVNGDGMDAHGSPANDSLFGGSPGAGDDLFGDNFGGDDDNEFSRAMLQDSAQDAQDLGNPAGADSAMADFDMSVPTMDGTGGDVTNDPTALDSFTTGNDAGTGVEGISTSFELTQATDPMTDFSQDVTTQHEMPQSPSTLLDPAPAPESPSAVFAAPPLTHYDTTQTSDSTFLSASIDGTLKIWDRRVPNPVARIGNRIGVPPWCMGACWSPDGNWIYVGRRNGTVEEFSVEKARGGHKGWQPERVFKFPHGSGPVSCVRAMPNSRHLICASHDILRLYDLKTEEKSTKTTKHSPPPFLIVPGPPRAGVIASLYIDPTSRFMISAAGTRGWEGTCTEVMIGYEINVPR